MSKYATKGRVMGTGLLAIFVVVVGLLALFPKTGSAWFSFTSSSTGELEAKLDAQESKIDALEAKLDAIEGKLDQSPGTLEAKLDAIEAKLDSICGPG